MIINDYHVNDDMLCEK